MLVIDQYAIFFACFSNTMELFPVAYSAFALSQSLLINRTCYTNSSNMCFDLIGYQGQNMAKVSVKVLFTNKSCV